MIKTYLSKTSIFKAFAAICIFGISISGCTSKKKTPMETTDTTENELTMLVGTYTSGTSKGIYSYRFNEEDGTATPLSDTEVENPSYLVPSADGKFVYAVSEFNNTQAAANAFAFNKEKGTLQLLNSQQTGGEDPCYIIASGNNVITANYSGGSISVSLSQRWLAPTRFRYYTIQRYGSRQGTTRETAFALCPYHSGW